MRGVRFGIDDSCLRRLWESWRELKRLQASQEVTKELIQELKLAIQESYAALERIRECMRERKNS